MYENKRLVTNAAAPRGTRKWMSIPFWALSPEAIPADTKAPMVLI